jgi:hypothetical protein
MIVRLVGRQGKEGSVRDQFAVGKPKFSESLAMGQESMHWFVTNKFALVEVDFKDVRAVIRKCQDGRIFELSAFIKFKLEMISISPFALGEEAHPLDISALLSDLDHRLVRDLVATGDIEPLQSPAVVRQSKHRGLGDLYIP